MEKQGSNKHSPARLCCCNQGSALDFLAMHKHSQQVIQETRLLEPDGTEGSEKVLNN